MNYEIHPAEALMGELVYGGPERVWNVPENATIKLAEGTGHLLTGAVIVHWSGR